jgi:hypothetical protein
MTISRKRAQEYADQLLARPRSEVPVSLRRTSTGVTLLHEGRALTRCHASRVGNLQAVFMAQALGVNLPERGSTVSTEVSTGVLFRALSISALNLRQPEARMLLTELLATAAVQRGAEAVTA